MPDITSHPLKKSAIPETIYEYPRDPRFTYSLWMNAAPKFYFQGEVLGINSGAEWKTPRPVAIDTWGRAKKDKWWHLTEMEKAGAHRTLSGVIAFAEGKTDSCPSGFASQANAVKRLFGNF